jgi:glutamate formiminotransferase
MVEKSLSENNIPLLPYDFSKSLRVIAFEKNLTLQVHSEKKIPLFLYKEISRYLRQPFDIKLCSSVDFDQLLTKYYA